MTSAAAGISRLHRKEPRCEPKPCRNLAKRYSSMQPRDRPLLSARAVKHKIWRRVATFFSGSKISSPCIFAIRSISNTHSRVGSTSRKNGDLGIAKARMDAPTPLATLETQPEHSTAKEGLPEKSTVFQLWGYEETTCQG